MSALAQRFERLLARLGQPCPEGRTWNEHLRLTEEFIEARRSPLEAFVSEYSRFRFGPLPSSSEIAQLERELRSLEFSAKKETV